MYEENGAMTPLNQNDQLTDLTPGGVHTLDKSEVGLMNRSNSRGRPHTGPK